MGLWCRCGRHPAGVVVWLGRLAGYTGLVGRVRRIGLKASFKYSTFIHALTVIFLLSYISSMFEVLVEPHRRRILDLLREGEQTVGDLVSELGLSQPGVSKHLRVLRQAGLVEVRADGQRRRYRLRTEPLREIDEWLAPYRAAWSRRLDVLEAHLDDMDE